MTNPLLLALYPQRPRGSLPYRAAPVNLQGKVQTDFSPPLFTLRGEAVGGEDVTEAKRTALLWGRGYLGTLGGLLHPRWWADHV